MTMREMEREKENPPPPRKITSVYMKLYETCIPSTMGESGRVEYLSLDMRARKIQYMTQAAQWFVSICVVVACVYTEEEAH